MSARVHSATFQPSRRKINLSSVIKGAALKVTPKAKERDVQISMKLPKGNIFIPAIPGQLETAVYHLLLNAVNFSTGEGIVECILEEKKNHFKIKVKDHGRGIPARELDRIFSKFYQVEGHMTRTVDGLGLGLPLVKQIAENQGGKVSVKSSIGKGSLFTLNLPKIPPETEVCEKEIQELKTRLTAARKQSLEYAEDLKELLIKRM